MDSQYKPEKVWAWLYYIFSLNTWSKCKWIANFQIVIFKKCTCRILFYEYYKKESKVFWYWTTSERILKFKINNFTFNYCSNILSEHMFKNVLITSFQQAAKHVLLFILNSFKSIIISVTEKPVKEKTCCIQRSEIQDKNHTVNTLPQRVAKEQKGNCALF